MNKSVIAGALLGLVLGSGLVGCSGPSGPSAGPSVDPSRVSPTDLPTPPTVTDPQGDVKDLTLGDCKTEAGEQVVTGKLTSTLDSAADFLVTVSWTTASGDVMGRGFKVIEDLAPGKTSEFEIKATVAPGATQCVKGVEYGTIKA
ncbi:MAG: hypothetical protein IT193_11135 [Propionibacteriaceae bacterium]|nr:hypothetical protein [Propionibacteriaceae bacterium]